MQSFNQKAGEVIWRALKVTPIVGYIFIIAAAPAVLRRKGYFLGSLAVALDLLPIICLIKASVEIFTGDLIPDRFETSTQQGLELVA